MKIYIDRGESTISNGGKPKEFTYFSYLWHELKYWGPEGTKTICLWSEYEIYINGKLRWKK